MERFVLRVLPVLLLTCAAAWAQAAFSADIVNLSATTNTFHTRIFSMPGKLRFQQEVKSGRVDSIMIVNLAAHSSIVLIPQQKQYVTSSRPQIPGQGVTFFQPKDVENACAEWEALIHLSEAAANDDHDAPRKPAVSHKCQKLGHETANGRDTVKYQDTPGTGDPSVLWIDAKLHFPVKWKNAVSSGELQNIQEARQPGELFTIPADYTKRAFSAAPPKAKASQP